MRSSRAAFLGVVAAILMGACGSTTTPATSSEPAASVEQGSLEASSPASSQAASPEPPAPRPSVAATPARADPSSSPTPPPAGEFLPGSVLATLADDGLRVRSKPGVTADSLKLEPLLPLGTQVLVLQGPVSASGYDWYEIASMTSRELPGGWVAAIARDGTPWLRADEFRCPSLPADMRSLAALPPGVGLACFARQPITVKARLVSCNCDMDGSSYSPSWFFLGSGGPTLLVDPGQRDVPSDIASWFPLSLDPDGDHPEVLPLGDVVQVTGMFDHPAAAQCTETEMDGQPSPSTGCRLRFAVTRLTAGAP